MNSVMMGNLCSLCICEFQMHEGAFVDIFIILRMICHVSDEQQRDAEKVDKIHVYEYNQVKQLCADLRG